VGAREQERLRTTEVEPTTVKYEAYVMDLHYIEVRSRESCQYDNQAKD
jgi:hypothetical protein